MKNNKLANQIKLLHDALFDVAKEVVSLQHDIRALEREKSDEVTSIIDGARRDILVVKDNLHRVRRKLFN